MNSNSSRPTPGPIARQLRQEAGFGCCKCGHPIFQYHHIIPFNEEEHFRPKDMMVLCPNCHDEATQGAMTEKEQRKYKSQPYNMKRGYAKGMLKINDNRLIIEMGNNYFVDGGSIIRVDGSDIIRLDLSSEGRLELTANLYDEQDNLLVTIVRNEWISGSITPWDIESKYRLLRIRKRKGAVDLTIDVRKTPTYIRANLWSKGHLISVDPRKIRVDRQGIDWQFIDCTFVRSWIDLHTQPYTHVTIEPKIIG
jgi:uncharacterized CHY-type Zn-finger protein